MFGSIISAAIKVVTVPIDIAEATVDVVSGGDGSKQSRKQSDANILSEVRDGICNAIEDIDK
jgi:hypothetical protein